MGPKTFKSSTLQTVELNQSFVFYLFADCYGSVTTSLCDIKGATVAGWLWPTHVALVHPETVPRWPKDISVPAWIAELQNMLNKFGVVTEFVENVFAWKLRLKPERNILLLLEAHILLLSCNLKLRPAALDVTAFTFSAQMLKLYLKKHILKRCCLI